MRRYSPTKLYDGAQMANFCVLFASCVSASRVQHISNLHSKFALSHTMACGSMVDIQSATAEIRQGNGWKNIEENTGQKYNGLPIT